MFNLGVCLLEAVYELATRSDIGDIADEAWNLFVALHESDEYEFF